jgi:hypothetical protein
MPERLTPMVAEHWPIISNSSHVVNSRSQHRARTSQRQNSRQVLAIVQDVVSAMVSLHAQSPGLHRVLFEEKPLPRSLPTEDRSDAGRIDYDGGPRWYAAPA